MRGFVEDGLILENIKIGVDVWKMVIKAPKQASTAKVGMFCNVKVNNTTAPFLRRPISYAGFDAEKGTVDLLYRVVGEGTKLMTNLKAGEFINILGPLGTSFKPSNNMLLVGGGVGIAPMLCMASKLEEGQKATVLLGFKDKTENFWAELFKDYPVKVHITTDDGSLGTKGYPTAVMADICAEEKIETIHTCGPTPMMKSVAAIAQALNVKCEVSLEEHMGCGTGGCFGCGCHGKGGKRYKVCTHGPVFKAEEVFF